MTHARIVADQIVETGVPALRPVYFADRWWDCRDETVRAEYIAAADWRPIVTTPRPANTATTTSTAVVVLIGGVPTQQWVPREWTAEELASIERAAYLDSLQEQIVTQAIAWLEDDAAAAQGRAVTVADAVATATARRDQVQGFTFNGTTIATVNGQLNNSLKPILVDMLTYIIGLGQLAQGTETWRGTRADPSLVWLARHTTGTAEGV